MKKISRRNFCAQLLKTGFQASFVFLSAPVWGNAMMNPPNPKTMMAWGKDGLDLNAMIRPVPESAVMKMDDWYVWGGTVVKSSDGIYHLLFSRWPKKLGMEGWVTHSEIARATSESPIGPFTFQDVALPPRGRQYWDGEVTHNPTVQKFGDKYYLYYNGNREFDGKVESKEKKYDKWWRHRNNQRVGLAVADHPAGPWKRFDKPLLEVGPWDWNGLITTNPSITKRPDGKYLLTYKTVATAPEKDMPFGGKVTHGVAFSDNPMGPFKKHPEPVFTHPTAKFPAEDPYIFFLDGYYWGILKDMEGFFIESDTQQLVLFQSKDGIDWKLADHPLVTKPRIPWENGQAETVSRLERPQLLIEDGRPVVLYVGILPREGKSYNVHIPLQKIK
jgi:predicted GH43/DUF377 family glycosyl hydrolase